MKIVKEFLPYVVIILVVILIRAFLVEPITVEGISMEPTLYDGDYMFLNKFNYYFSDIKRFDIVVIQREEERVIKRIIGLPGETLRYEDNVLYINDQIVEETYTRKEMFDFSLSNIDVEIIPKDMYLVLGDNRPDSKDSSEKDFGLVSREKILGKAHFVLLPFENFGWKE